VHVVTKQLLRENPICTPVNSWIGWLVDWATHGLDN